MKDYRRHLQKRYGLYGEALWDVVDNMIQGRPWVPVLPDGQETLPVVPSTSDRMHAVKLALAYLHGSPVSTVEVRGKLEHTHVRASLEALDSETLLRIVNGDESALPALPPSTETVESPPGAPQLADWFSPPDDAK